MKSLHNSFSDWHYLFFANLYMFARAKRNPNVRLGTGRICSALFAQPKFRAITPSEKKVIE
ncbi:MAG: hypothetical protein ACPL28_01310 [bacterium]